MYLIAFFWHVTIVTLDPSCRFDRITLCVINTSNASPWNPRIPRSPSPPTPTTSKSSKMEAARPSSSQKLQSPNPYSQPSSKRKSKYDPDAIATTRSVFDDPLLAKYYAPHPSYENLHRFDPNARWTYHEEASVRRKTDYTILLWILVMFFGLNLDRGNLGTQPLIIFSMI